MSSLKDKPKFTLIGAFQMLQSKVRTTEKRNSKVKVDITICGDISKIGLEAIIASLGSCETVCQLVAMGEKADIVSNIEVQTEFDELENKAPTGKVAIS